MKVFHIDFYKLDFYEVLRDIMVGTEAYVGFDEAEGFTAHFIFLRRMGNSALGPNGKNGAVLVPLKGEGETVFLSVRDFAHLGIRLYTPLTESVPKFFIFDYPKGDRNPMLINGSALLSPFKESEKLKNWIEFPVFMDSKERRVFSMDDEKMEFLEEITLTEDSLSVFYAKNAKGAKIFDVKGEDGRHTVYLAPSIHGRMEKKGENIDTVLQRGDYMILLKRAKKGTTVTVYGFETGIREVDVSFPDINEVYDAMYDAKSKTLYLFSSTGPFCFAFHLSSGKRKYFRVGSLSRKDRRGVTEHFFAQGENGEVFVWYGLTDQRGDIWIYGRKIFGKEGEIEDNPLKEGPVRVVRFGNKRAPYRPVYGTVNNYEIVIFDDRGNVEKTGASLKGGILYDEVFPNGDFALILSTESGNIKVVRKGKMVNIDGEFKEHKAYPIEIPDIEGERFYGAILRKKKNSLFLIFPKEEEGGGAAYTKIPFIPIDFLGVRASFATGKRKNGKRVITIVTNETGQGEITTITLDKNGMKTADHLEAKSNTPTSLYPLNAFLVREKRKRTRKIGTFEFKKRDVTYIHISENGKIYAKDPFFIDGEKSNVDTFLFERDGNRYYAVKTDARKEDFPRLFVEIEERPSGKRYVLKIPLPEEFESLIETLKGDPETTWSLLVGDENNFNLMKKSVKYIIESGSSHKDRHVKDIQWQR